MPREKSITDLKDERTQLSIRAKAITDGARAEKRMLNEGENTELGEIQCRMTDINMEIATKEAENRGKGTPHVEPGQERFSPPPRRTFCTGAEWCSAFPPRRSPS